MQEPDADMSRPAKRQRLTLACNECRKRKVKCDSRLPRCKNCHIRDIVCETTDPKHPELTVIRKYRAELPDEGCGGGGMDFPSPANTIAASIAGSEGPQSLQKPDETGGSWLARSYRAHRAVESASPAAALTDRRTSQVATQIEPADTDSPEMAINIDNRAGRQKLMGGSSLQSLTMFLDLYLQRAGLPRVGPCFKHGMSFVEEFAPLLIPSLPDLPPPSLTDAYLKAYCANIHPLFPILKLSQLHADVQRIRSYQDASWSPSGGFRSLHSLLQPHDIPTLACIYGAISLGADELAGSLTEAGTDFLSAAHGLYAHLIGFPHLSSVQALLLITLALRSRGKEGQGFQTLGSAIRISHSIGIHHHVAINEQVQDSVPLRSGLKQLELHARVWWTCYSLEKLMEVETTRPSAISHSQHDVFIPNRIFTPNSLAKFRFFIHWVSLAGILEQINELLYQRKRNPDSTLQLLQSIGRIDSALKDWKNGLPEDIQPDGDMFCNDEERPFAIFLALQYHQTLITLHRASLVLPQDQFVKDIDTHAPNLPFHQRLRRGQNFCTASACATLRLSANMPDKRLQTPSYTLTQTLHGCVVLALNIMRQPKARTVRTDLELLRTGSELAEAEYRRLGQHPKFIEACTILEKSVTAYVEQTNSGRVSRDLSQAPRDQIQGTPMSAQTGETAMPPPTWESMVPENFGSQEDFQIDTSDLFAGIMLEDLWGVPADIDPYGSFQDT